MSKFYQVCYGKIDEGWDIVNASGNIPAFVTDFFRKYSAGCVDEITKIKKNEKLPEDFCLYEIISEEGIVCVLRAKMDDVDMQGRSKMFVHGYLFVEEDIWKDVNGIMGIADNNFNFDPVSTKEIPDYLEYDEKRYFDAIRKKLEINNECWENLLACVYMVVSSKRDFPLQIKSSLNTTEIKDVIFCILTSLPYSLRQKLSFSNARSFGQVDIKRIMFVENVANGWYFDLQTGETNVALDIVKEQPEKFPSLYAALELSATEFEAYCEKIDGVLEAMGIKSNAGFDEVTLANKFLLNIERLNEKTDEELTEYMLKLLKEMPIGNEYVDDFIAKVLYKYDERGLIPNEYILQPMIVRNDETPSPDYVEVYKRIQTRVLMDKGQGDLLAFMKEQYYKCKSIFEDWCITLLKFPNGEENIIAFYEYLIREQRNINDLVKIKENAKNYWQNLSVKTAALSVCLQITNESVSNCNINENSCEQHLQELKNVLGNLFGERAVPDLFNKKCFPILAEAFWKKFDFKNFRFEKVCIDNCCCMQLKNNEVSRNVELLVEIYRICRDYMLERVIYNDVERAIGRFVQENTLANQQLEDVTPIIQEHLLERMEEETSRHFVMWELIARLDDPVLNPLERMVEWKLPVICNAENFKVALMESSRMQRKVEKILQWLQGKDGKGGILASGNLDTELQKTFKQEIKILSEYKKKQAEILKKQEKEEKKEMAKQKDTKPAKQKEEKAGLFGGIFGKRK